MRQYDDSDLLKISATSEIFSVSGGTVAGWIKQGHLAAFDVRGTGSQSFWRIVYKDVEHFIEFLRSKTENECKVEAEAIRRTAALIAIERVEHQARI